MDIGSILGLVIGFLGILLGFLIEAHWHFSALSGLIQVASIFIVFGGTIGAVILTFPMDELKKLGSALKLVFTKTRHDEVGIINKMIDLA